LLRQLKGKCADSCVPDIKSEDRYRIKSASLTPIYLKWNSYKNRLTGVVDITYRKCTKEENLARRELEK